MTNLPSRSECELAKKQGERARLRQADQLQRTIPSHRDPTLGEVKVRTAVVRKATAIVDRDKGLVAFIEAQLEANQIGEGRPREISVRSALICFVLLALLGENFHLIDLPVLMSAMTWRVRRQLGIDYLDRRGRPKQVSYQQILRIFHAIAEAFDPLASDISDEKANKRAVALRELSFRLVQASISVPRRPGDYAIDATLKWGWDRPGGLHAKIERRGRDGDGERPLSLSEILEDCETSLEPDCLAELRAELAKGEHKGPRTWGAGSRWVGRENSKKSVYGVALHAVTLAEPTSPPVIEAITVAPAPALPAPVVMPLLELLYEKRKGAPGGRPIGDVVADPAYSAKPTAWQLPIRHLGGSPVFRLHRQNQAGRQLRAGVSFVDGRPYCSCIPDELADIAFPHFPATRSQLFGYANKVTKRRRFELTANTAFKADLSRQFRFPHWDPVKKRGGCYHCVDSQNNPLIDPLTGLARPVCCQQATKVFSAEDLGLYQDVAYGEIEWFERWNRRNRVEGSFGIMKNPSVSNWSRHYHHFVGLSRETFVALFAVVAHNFHVERNWMRRQELRERLEGKKLCKKRRRNDQVAPERAPNAAPITAPAGRGPKGLEFLGTPRDGP
jgi:hypothetical protein